MRKSLIIFILTTVWFCSCGQRNKSSTVRATNDSQIVAPTVNDTQKLSPIYNLDNHIFSDTLYTSPTGKGITIQNSFPRGGSYNDPTGNNFGYGIFWTRVINETASPFELTVNFPADSSDIFPEFDFYLKLFLPPGKMTLDKVSLFDYGATGLFSFLDNDLNNPTLIKRTINPKEEYIFYIGMLFQVPNNGPVRTELVLKEQDLFYKINIAPYGSTIIPCGKIQ